MLWELSELTGEIWSPAEQHEFSGKLELGQKFLPDDLIY